jgi:hypothetical protein
MANTQATFGFQLVGSWEGVSPTYGQATRYILSSNNTPIYNGDPVIISGGNGVIQQATAGTSVIDGIFIGCKYLSTSQGRTIWNSYWPGTDASANAEAYVITDPNALFKVAALAAPFTLSMVGRNVQFNLGTGNTTTGISGATVDSTTVATTATLPFRVYKLWQDYGASGSNGTDPTTNYNWVVVGFNNTGFKALTPN